MDVQWFGRREVAVNTATVIVLWGNVMFMEENTIFSILYIYFYIYTDLTQCLY